MAGKIVADTLEHSTAGSLDTQYVVNGSAKAFVSGNTTATPQESFNVASGTDNGTGDFSYSVTNAFTNDDYILTASALSTAARFAVENQNRNTSSVIAVQMRSDTASATNTRHNIAVHGDLA